MYIYILIYKLYIYIFACMYVSRDLVELSWGCQGQFSNSGKGLGFAQVIGASFLTEVST
jgi:hypothetical protein